MESTAKLKGPLSGGDKALTPSESMAKAGAEMVRDKDVPLMERKRLTIEQFLKLSAMMEDEEHKERLATEAASAKMIEASKALEASMAAAGGVATPGKGLGALKLGWGRARGSLAGAIAKAAAPLEAPV